MLAIAPLHIYAQQIYTWSVPSGAWSVATNWSPHRNTPATDDILEFNIPATITDLPGAETVGKISVYNSAAVNFSASATSSITIGNANVSAPHFSIEIGATLNTTGSNPVTFNMAPGYSGLIDGNLSFAGSTHRLTATTTNAIVFSDGAVFTANSGFSGNPFGNVTANQNTVVFQSGATYIFRAGGNPFGLAAPNAVTVFNSGSIYRHQVNGTGPSFAGRTYGNIYIEANVNFAGIGSANDCTIQNDLNVLSGFFSFKPNSLGIHSGNFSIYGNILASGTSYIDIGSNFMPGSVQLLGTAQNISGSGTGTVLFDHFTINNASTVTLQRPVSVSGIFSLLNGKVMTTVSSLLTLTSTASIQSCTHDYFNLPYSNMGCDLSYVEGPLQKLGLVSNDFIFPVGINGKLRPAAVRNATGDFTVEYIRGDPYLDLSSTMGTGIHHTSRLEYWNIDGNGSASIELTYFDPNSGGVTDMNALRVAWFTGTEWADQGVAGYLGSPGANGSITSSYTSALGSFTLAGALGYPNNPLPDNSIIFNVFIQLSNVLLNWTFGNETIYQYYQVERASKAGIYNPISSEIFIQESDNQTYTFTDHSPGKGSYFYRLKLVKWNGDAVYSVVKSIQFDEKPDIRVYPNPGQEKYL